MVVILRRLHSHCWIGLMIANCYQKRSNLLYVLVPTDLQKKLSNHNNERHTNT